MKGGETKKSSREEQEDHRETEVRPDGGFSGVRL